MKLTFIKKSIVFTIIMLFIGASTTPILESSTNAEIRNTCSVEDNDTSLSMDDSSWQWAVKGGGTGQDNSWSICIDTDNNTYITGYFNGTVLFGTITLVSSGGFDLFVAKLNSDGVWQWAVQGGGAGIDEGRSICVDPNGNIYITGSFNGTALFGSTMLSSLGFYDVVVAKLNNDGVWQWAVQGGGTYFEDIGYGICVDANGNVYVTGYFGQTAVFGTITLVSIGICDVFVAKLNNNGVWQWAVQSSVIATGGAFGDSIFLDTNENLYITGYFSGIALFGTIVLTSSGIFESYVAKLNKNGVWQWAVQSTGGGSSLTMSLSLYLDSNGNLYITGMFYGTVIFGTTTLTSSESDIFVGKLTQNGVWQWAVQGGGTGFDSGSSIQVDADGNAYVIGMFQETAWFGSITLTSSGDNDVFVAKLNANGYWQWARQAGGINIDAGRGLCLDSEENIYVTGFFSDTAVFGTITLVSSGDYDVFVAKLVGEEENQPPIFGTPAPHNSSINNPVSFTYSIPINDPEGNQISWTIQCSNGQISSGTGETNGTKLLPLSGLAFLTTYTIWVNATDPDGSGLCTREWYTFTTKANEPPNQPTITGPAKGKIRVAIKYNFTTTDPDNDTMSYYIDWGDDTNSGWIGPYSSGDVVTKSHTWTKKGDYTIKAKAKDSSGNESDWGTLSVTMPYKLSPFRFFEWLFNRFPNAFPILRHILGY